MAHQSSPYPLPNHSFPYQAADQQQQHRVNYRPLAQPMVVIPQRSDDDQYHSNGSHAPQSLPRQAHASRQKLPHRSPGYNEPQFQDQQQQHFSGPPTYPFLAPPQTQQHVPQPQSLVPSVPPPIARLRPPGNPTSIFVEVGRPTQKPPPPIDYHLLLLSLAEEYITAAHRIGSEAALSKNDNEEEQYYKLLATGLGCIESVLKNYKLQPRQEAILELRYANILVSETENDLEAETILTKAIITCERHRLLDLKYSMQHLLARLLSKTNKRAALKYLDNVISEVEAYKHIVWVYAFRFLKVSLALQAPSHTDVISALQTLRNIATVAEQRGDIAVLVTTAVLEAITHLRSSSSDAVEQAQRAIATARSFQLEPSLRTLPQVNGFLELVDLACSLQHYNPEQAAQKMTRMQTVLDKDISDENWSDDGSFAIPIENKSEAHLTELTGGIFQRGDDGRDRLRFAWIRQKDLFALGYYLSGVAKFSLNNANGRKSEKFLREGIEMTEDNASPNNIVAEALVNASDRHAWRRQLNCHLRIHLTFTLCSRTSWTDAKSSLEKLKSTMEAPGVEIPKFLIDLATYLSGVICQGTGDLSSALDIYQSATFTLPETPSRTTNPRTELSILAGLNCLLILRDPTHPRHALAEPLLASLEPWCVAHPNQNIIAAFHLIKAVGTSSSIIKTKQFLQLSLKSAKAIANNQLMCIVLNFMSAKFFTSIVGEQAEKAGRAGRTMAKKTGDVLWECVADGMVGETLDNHGRVQEANVVREEGRALAGRLPEALRERCFREEEIETLKD